jgi:DNA-binding transcriptional LysR family regulator
MRFFQFDYILTVAEEKSFTKAAKKLYIAQPSLSQYVKNVENDLKVELFDRSVSPLRLTSAGCLFVETARQIMFLQSQMKNQLIDLANLKSGTLRVGFTPFRSTCILPLVLTQFKRRYSSIDIAVTTGVTPRLYQYAQDGLLDIFTSNETSINKSLFQFHHICEEKVLLAVPPQHPINTKYERYRLGLDAILKNRLMGNDVLPIPLSEFKLEHFLLSAPSQDLHNFSVEIFRRAGFTPNVALTAQNIETLLAMTIVGLGLSFIPCTYIRFGNIANHATYYCIDDEYAVRNFVIAHKKDSYLSDAAQAFISMLREIMA